MTDSSRVVECSSSCDRRRAYCANPPVANAANNTRIGVRASDVVPPAKQNNYVGGAGRENRRSEVLRWMPGTSDTQQHKQIVNTMEERAAYAC